MSRLAATPTRRALALAPFAALLLALAGPAGGIPGGTSVLPFRAASYEEALAAAKARDLPLFIESWAPW